MAAESVDRLYVKALSWVTAQRTQKCGSRHKVGKHVELSSKVIWGSRIGLCSYFIGLGLSKWW